MKRGGVKSSKGDKKEKTAKKPCNRCGSKTHSRSMHRDCPYNKKNKPAKAEPAYTAAVTGKSPTTHSADELGDSDDSTSMKGYCNLLLSDDELDVDMVDDVIMSSCTCGANNRAHKRTCPMNSRAQYPTGRQHETPKHKPGDYVDLHSMGVKDEHLTCRVIECLTKPAANQYRLSCTNGVLTQLLPESDLTKFSFIPLDRWRTSPRLMIRDAWSDLHSLHKCV